MGPLRARTAPSGLELHREAAGSVFGASEAWQRLITAVSRGVCQCAYPRAFCHNYGLSCSLALQKEQVKTYQIAYQSSS